jgi:hypothetical protein
MRIIYILFCALTFVLASCQGDHSPTASRIDIVDLEYQLSYKIVSSDSFEVRFDFQNADTNHFTEFEIRFGDSSVSALFASDTSIWHSYNFRDSFVVGLFGRVDSNAVWLELNRVALDLRQSSPSYAQLSSSKLIAYKISGRFAIYTNWSGPNVSRYETKDLKGSPQLDDLKWNHDTSRLSFGWTSYYRYDDPSGGYFEEYSGHLSVREIPFLREDSLGYVFGASSPHAFSRISYGDMDANRWGYTDTRLHDSASIEIIFYK